MNILFHLSGFYLVPPMQEERDDDQDDEKREHEAGYHEHHRVHAHGADVLAGESH